MLQKWLEYRAGRLFLRLVGRQELRLVRVTHGRIFSHDAREGELQACLPDSLFVGAAGLVDESDSSSDWISFAAFLNSFTPCPIAFIISGIRLAPNRMRMISRISSISRKPMSIKVPLSPASLRPPHPTVNVCS